MVERKAILTLFLIFTLWGNGLFGAECPKDLPPMEQELHRLIVKAEGLMDEGKDLKTLALLDKYARKNPSENHPHLAFVRGLLNYRLRRMEKAEALFTNAVESHPCFGEAWQNLAIIRHEQKRPAEAAEAMEKAFGLIRPEKPELLYQAAIFRFRAHQPGKALPLLRELSQRKEPHLEWVLALANTQERLGQKKQAAGTLQKAYGISRDPEHLYRAACLWLKLNQPARATSLLKKLARRQNPQSQWLLTLGGTLKRQKRFADAAAVMDRVYRRLPEPDHLYQTALLWLNANQPEKALALLSKLSERPAPRVEWLQVYADLLTQQGRFRDAAAIREKIGSTERNPEQGYLTATLHLKAGSPEKALPLLEKLASEPAPSAKSLIVLGMTYDRLDQPEKAIAAMARADVDDPAISPEMRLQVGIFWMRLDNPKRALPLLKEAANTPHPSISCRMALIKALVLTGAPRQADPVLRILLDESPQDVRIWRLASWIAIERKDYPKAAAALEVAYRLKPADPEDWKRLGDLYRLSGVPLKGTEAYGRAFGPEPGVEALDLLAETYMEGHALEKALDAAVRAARQEPTVKRWARLGDMYLRCRDYTKSMRAFQKAAQLDDAGGCMSLRAGYAAWKVENLAVAKKAFLTALKRADSRDRTAQHASRALAAIEQVMRSLR